MNDSNPSASNPVDAERATQSNRQDANWVERLQATGDPDAFRSLYNKYHSRALSVALGVVRNAADAADVVQEAFVRVHRNIDKFEGSSSFFTWLYRIVMNVAIDHVRKHGRRQHVDFDSTVAVDESLSSDEGNLLPSPIALRPDAAVLSSELGMQIREALASLPEHHRAVIVLREVEGMSYHEIAEVLDVPKGTVMSRLFHARRRMQELLAPYLGVATDTKLNGGVE